MASLPRWPAAACRLRCAAADVYAPKAFFADAAVILRKCLIRCRTRCKDAAAVFALRRYDFLYAAAAPRDADGDATPRLYAAALLPLYRWPLMPPFSR